jgi:hypothetical protein
VRLFAIPFEIPEAAIRTLGIIQEDLKFGAIEPDRLLELGFEARRIANAAKLQLTIHEDNRLPLLFPEGTELQTLLLHGIMETGGRRLIRHESRKNGFQSLRKNRDFRGYEHVLASHPEIGTALLDAGKLPARMTIRSDGLPCITDEKYLPPLSHIARLFFVTNLIAIEPRENVGAREENERNPEESGEGLFHVMHYTLPCEDVPRYAPHSWGYSA